MDIIFEEILPINNQINDLYDLLKKRDSGISHKSLPSYNEHKEFVLKNPYKYWYLILLNENKIGTFYIMKNNSVGINLTTYNREILKKIISYIKENFSPEKEILSLVPKYFYINISSENIEMKKLFEGLGIPLIQITYKI